jgi:LysM repeat protein
VHAVAKGETLFGIAHAHGLSLTQLFAANPALKKIDPTKLPIGTKIVIPPR